MFAYCLNNPVLYYDPDGYETMVYNDRTDGDTLDGLLDAGGGGASSAIGGGGGIWSSFTRTMRSAADGLSQAAGQKDLSHFERHHMMSDKNKTYTPQYKEIADRYNMSLHAEENTVELPGHRGRHTNAYHEFMLSTVNELDYIAAGNAQVFAEGLSKIAEFLTEYWWIPYAK